MNFVTNANDMNIWCVIDILLDIGNVTGVAC